GAADHRAVRTERGRPLRPVHRDRDDPLPDRPQGSGVHGPDVRRRLGAVSWEGEAMKSTMTIRNLLSGRRSALVAAAALALAIPAGASAATSSSALLACQKSFESQIRSFTNSTIARLSNCTE